jgi:hypothetical protein
MAVGGSRTLKLSILADIDNLKKNLDNGSNEVEGFGSKLGGFAKKAGAAFAAAGAAAALYAGKYLVEATKNAAEDEKAQRNLALTLENTTGATRSQIAAVEDYITKTSLAFGVTDDQLRPAFERLTRSTKDTQKSQELLNLAVSISAATSKPLEVITAALAKAYDGNAASLGKLGLGVDANILKSKDFDAITSALRENFAGFAEQEANTFEGKMRRLQIAFDEGKETIGSYVLDGITPLLSAFVDKGVPAISKFADGLGKTLGPVFAQIFTFIRDELLPVLMKWWKFLYDEVIPAIGSIVGPVLEGLRDAFFKIKKVIADNSEELKPFFDLLKQIWEFTKKYLAPFLGTVFKASLEGIATAVSILVTGFSSLVSFITAAYNMAKKLVEFIVSNPILKGIGSLLGDAFGGGKAMGGPVISGTSYLVGERGPELFTPSVSGMITPNNRMGGGNTTINLNVSGAIDPEGTARTIIDVLNNSFYRGTGGANSLQFSG